MSFISSMKILSKFQNKNVKKMSPEKLEEVSLVQLVTLTVPILR